MMATSAFNEKFEFIKTDNTIKTREQQQFTSRKISKSNKDNASFFKVDHKFLQTGYLSLVGGTVTKKCHTNTTIITILVG